MIRYHLARLVFGLFQYLLADMQVNGRENIPPQGPYIVTVNHFSAADTPIMLLAFPAQKWIFFAGVSSAKVRLLERKKPIHRYAPRDVLYESIVACPFHTRDQQGGTIGKLGE